MSGNGPQPSACVEQSSSISPMETEITLDNNAEGCPEVTDSESPSQARCGRVSSGIARSALEFWACAAVPFGSVYCITPSHSGLWYASRIILLSCNLPILALFWGCIDWKIMKILTLQLKYWLVHIMVIWMYFCKVFGERHRPPSWNLLFYWLQYAPFPVFMSFDMLTVKSEAFRLIFPLAISSYLGALYYHSITKHPATPLFNVTLFTSPVTLYVEDQLANSIAIIATCLATTVWSMLKHYKDNHDIIFFPVHLPIHRDLAYPLLHASKVLTSHSKQSPYTTEYLSKSGVRSPSSQSGDSFWRSGCTSFHARVMLELWVSTCMIVGAVIMILPFQYRTVFHPIHFTLFCFAMTSPPPFIALCWGHMDWDVMRLLSGQFSFWLVPVMVLWIIVCLAVLNEKEGYVGRHLSLLNVFFYLPYIMFLFMDGLKRKSRGFQIVFPLVMVVITVTGVLKNTFPQTKTSLFNIPSVGQTFDTVEGQLSLSYSVIMTCLISMVFSMLTNFRTGGEFIHFPVRLKFSRCMVDDIVHHRVLPRKLFWKIARKSDAFPHCSGNTCEVQA